MAELSRMDPVKPESAHVTKLRVIRSMRVSPGFMRVTLAGTGSRFCNEFTWLGYDHWFRLFLPAGDGVLELPEGPAEGWYRRLNAIPQDVRPPVRNYTIRQARPTARGWELDVDFVIHRSPATGQVDGVAATWAMTAQRGDEVGILDQGRIFNPGSRTGPVLVLGDESALPAAEAIAASLPRGQSSQFVLEIADQADRRDLAIGQVQWTVREPHQAQGGAALQVLAGLDPCAYGYAYVAGEAGFMLEAIKRLKAAGLPKNAIDFCAYWRPVRSRRNRTRAA